MAHRSEYISVAGVRTHVHRGGRGPSVLVLHPEYAASTWAPYHEQLAAHFRIYAPDHPGFGKSDRADSIETIDDLVIHYLDLLDTLELEQVALVGTSIGGWIAAELAVIQPQRIRRLVLVGAAGLAVAGVERFDVFLHPFEETLRHLFHDPSRAAQLLPAAVGSDEVARAYREATTLARLAWNPYFYNPKLERRLRRVTAPTLVVWGENDTFLPHAHGDAYARAIPHATLRTVGQCGHLVPFEQTDSFVEMVGAFLDGDA